MTLKAAIEEIKDEMTDIQTLIFADDYEANLLADAVLAAGYPLLFVRPFTIVDSIGSSGVIKGTVDLELFMLDKSDLITVDYSTETTETDFMEPMRLMARRFIHRLNEHEVIDPETAGIQQRTITPEYGMMDAHLMGVSVRCQVPIMERLTGICSP